MKKLKVVALLVVMMCGLVGCKEDVEVHTEYVKAQPLQLYTDEVVQETVEQAKVSAEIAIEEVEKESGVGLRRKIKRSIWTIISTERLKLYFAIIQLTILESCFGVVKSRLFAREKIDQYFRKTTLKMCYFQS